MMPGRRLPPSTVTALYTPPTTCMKGCCDADRAA